MNVRDGIKAVLICGPTASGKSALALSLAKELGGAVINADSMQVYAELRVITNRPAPGGGGHRAAPALWHPPRPGALFRGALARRCEAGAGRGGRQGWLPVIVGGTGLYFKALTEGLSDIPEIPPEIRERFRAAALAEPAEVLHAELARRDPATAARLRPSDTQRIVRALEVLEATGRPLAEWQGSKQPPLLPLAQAYPSPLRWSARSCTAAAMRGSTRCWRAARWRRRARLRR